MQYEVYARTDQGYVRQNNEDNFFLCGAVREDVCQGKAESGGIYSGKRLLFAVCDGMGGEDLGEVASLAAVQALMVDKNLDMYSEAQRNVNSANQAVWERQHVFKTDHMGTTLAAFAIDSGRGVAYNLGDSRVYYLRGELRQLTTDHTMANYLVELGVLSPEEAKTNINKNSLMKYIGMENSCEIKPCYSGEIQIENGDMLLICSDGLSSMLSDEEICEIMRSGKSCREIANELVDAALCASGTDNITAVVVRAEAAEN